MPEEGPVRANPGVRLVSPQLNEPASFRSAKTVPDTRRPWPLHLPSRRRMGPYPAPVKGWEVKTLEPRAG